MHALDDAVYHGEDYDRLDGGDKKGFFYCWHLLSRCQRLFFSLIHLILSR